MRCQILVEISKIIWLATTERWNWRSSSRPKSWRWKKKRFRSDPRSQLGSRSFAREVFVPHVGVLCEPIEIDLVVCVRRLQTPVGEPDRVNSSHRCEVIRFDSSATPVDDRYAITVRLPDGRRPVPSPIVSPPDCVPKPSAVLFGTCRRLTSRYRPHLRDDRGTSPDPGSERRPRHRSHGSNVGRNRTRDSGGRGRDRHRTPGQISWLRGPHSGGS